MAAQEKNEMERQRNEVKNRPFLNQEQGRYFDRAVAIFDRDQPPHILERLEKIVSEAGIEEGQTVLDVGAGVGALMPFIRAHSAGLVIACDLSGKMLARLKQKYPEVVTVQKDIRDLDLPDGSVDAIFMNAVFSNILDKPGTLANCSRMLRVGGRLIISHPEGRSFVEWLRKVIPFPLDPLPTHGELRKLPGTLPMGISRFMDREGLYLAVIIRNAQEMEALTG